MTILYFFEGDVHASQAKRRWNAGEPQRDCDDSSFKKTIAEPVSAHSATEPMLRQGERVACL